MPNPVGRPRIPRLGPTGLQIAKARHEAEFSQEKLGLLIDVPFHRISEWERGRSYPRKSQLALLYRYLPTLQ